MRIGSFLIGGATLSFALPAPAQLRPLVDPPASAVEARRGVEVFLLNEGPAAVPATGPAEIETVAKDGARLTLIAAPDEPLTVAPGGFARVHYRLAAATPAMQGADGTVASIRPGADAVASLPRHTRAMASATGETVVATSRGGAGGFLDRLHPYAPTYGAVGLGTAGAKLQLSFDARLLGRDDGPHLDFAYTHTIFWAVDRPSGPIRAQGYSPELFVDVPVGKTTIVGAGYRHDSNGGGVANSIDINRVYARATKVFDLGDAWRLSISPQAWFYFGDQGIAPDLDRYWGYTSLGVGIGQRDGVKLAVTGRGNPGSGKGSAEAFLSYPLAAINDELPHIYLFGQAFTGYGEALIDYRRRVTYARLGIAFTR